MPTSDTSGTLRSSVTDATLCTSGTARIAGTTGTAGTGVVGDLMVVNSVADVGFFSTHLIIAAFLVAGFLIVPFLEVPLLCVFFVSGAFQTVLFRRCLFMRCLLQCWPPQTRHGFFFAFEEDLVTSSRRKPLLFLSSAISFSSDNITISLSSSFPIFFPSFSSIYLYLFMSWPHSACSCVVFPKLGSPSPPNMLLDMSLYRFVENSSAFVNQSLSSYGGQRTSICSSLLTSTLKDCF